MWRDGSLILSGEKVFRVTQQHLHRAVLGEALTAPGRNRRQSSSSRERSASTLSLWGGGDESVGQRHLGSM